MKMYAIRNKKTKLYYNNLNWVTLEKARTFKRIGDLTKFIKYNTGPFYLKSGSNISIKGLPYFTNALIEGLPYFTIDKNTSLYGEMQITKTNEYEFVEIKLTDTNKIIKINVK